MGYNEDAFSSCFNNRAAAANDKVRCRNTSKNPELFHVKTKVRSVEIF